MIFEKHSKVPQRFLRDQLLFIHVPKNAGSSFVLNYLGYQPGHWRYQEYEAILGRNISKFFVFSIKRHPEKRFLSAFKFIKNGGMNLSDLKTYERIKDLNCNDVLLKLLKGEYLSEHFESQINFLKSQSKTINLNYVCDIDQISLLEIAMEAHGLPEIIIKQTVSAFSEKNRKNRNEKDQLYNSELDLDLLRQVYNDDFWRLGY